MINMDYTSMSTNTSTLIGMVMRELKKFALEFGITIFLITHLKKTRLEDEPNIDDLRDSSFIAQESDVVMIMWRNKIKNASAVGGWNYSSQASLIVTKNRPTGKLGGMGLIYNENKFLEEAKEYGN